LQKSYSIAKSTLSGVRENKFSSALADKVEDILKALEGGARVLGIIP
jgi:hypothetical protein